MKRIFFVAVLAMLAFSNVSFAQQWADLSVTFVYDGEIPKLKDLDGSADPYCAKLEIPNERLVIDNSNKGIANLVFMIDSKQKLDAGSIHPDLKDFGSEAVVMDNVKCQFVPHVGKVRAGQAFSVKNSDGTGHNAKFSFFNNPEVNPLIPANSSKSIDVKKSEVAPVKVECSIHPFMVGYVVVTDHPYVGISDAQGAVKIEKLPAGVELSFKLWHEAQDKFDEVTVNGKKESWKKGIVKMTLKPGANDLGVVKISSARFKP